MNAILLQRGFRLFDPRRDGTLDSTFMVGLHLSQHRNAVCPRSVVNELVVAAANQEQIGVLVSILVRHGRPTPRPLATVTNDVSHFSEDGYIVCFGAGFDEPPSAARECTNASRQQVQSLDFLLWNVAAQAITLLEVRGQNGNRCPLFGKSVYQQ